MRCWNLVLAAFDVVQRAFEVLARLKQGSTVLIWSARTSSAVSARAAISQTPKELVEQRVRWLNADGLSEAEKKQRTLTNSYNARPAWLDLAHERRIASLGTLSLEKRIK